MSDQTEKSKGTLPKGYEPNAQGEPQDQDKKIWDKYYNGEIELPDVVKELKHYRNSKDTELETSDEDQREKDLKEYEQKYLSRYKQPKTKKNVGSDLYKPEIPKPKTDRRKERKEYEQKYLSRYKQPKSGVKKSTSWTQHDVALGRLTLSPHFNAKRRAKQDEISKYEKQYISRYKQPKIQKKKTIVKLPQIKKKKKEKKLQQKDTNVPSEKYQAIASRPYIKFLAFEKDFF